MQNSISCHLFWDSNFVVLHRNVIDWLKQKEKSAISTVIQYNRTTERKYVDVLNLLITYENTVSFFNFVSISKNVVFYVFLVVKFMFSKKATKFDKMFTVNLTLNLCQKLLFLHQLTHNMTTDCSLIYEFSTCKLQPQNMLCI